MNDTLILTSTNGNILTDNLINSWLNENEIFIKKKEYSHDRYSVEVVFTDEERADMMLDLLNTCYSDCISVKRPEVLKSPLNESYGDERAPSPPHLSSALSVSSQISHFSQRLAALDKKNALPTIGRGRGAILK